MSRLAALVIVGFATAIGFSQTPGEWGTISGRITWGDAKVPVRAPLLFPVPKGCAIGLLDETWIVEPTNKDLKNTYVWLEPNKKGDKIPIHPSLAEAKPRVVKLDEPACVFDPHAIALRAGDILRATNSSAVGHAFRWQGNPAVNAGGVVFLPPGKTFDIEDLKADGLPVTLVCNIHVWMKSWIRVFDHPYFAVTDKDGGFTIKDAPAGNWRLKIWHGSGGWLGGVKGKDGQPIEVKAGENKLGDLKYPPPE
jgi:hypothetical protein